MLPARTTLSRRIVTRSFTTISLRHYSTRTTRSEENDASSQVNPGEDPTISNPSIPPKQPPSVVPSPFPQAPETPISDPSADLPPADKHHSWNDVSAYDLEGVKQRIRERTDLAIIAFRQRADDFTNQTKSTFSQLGAHLNKVTGYEEIEALKKEVTEQEERIKITRRAAKEAKIAYDQAVLQRSASQREVNELLQRKSLWTESDISRFTAIVRQDHLYEQDEARAKTMMDETEAAVEREFTQLMKSILARYHEEQVWSDKIRSASTYGSLAALGLNLIVFILAIVIVEPWKRRRLTQAFEAKIQELSVENLTRLEASTREIGEKFVEQENLLSRVLEEVSVLRGDTGSMVVTDVVVPGMTVETPPVERPPFASIPTLSQRTFELAAIGVGAFVLGVIGTVLTQ